MAKTSDIKFTIQLNEKKIPKKIEWEATDAGFDGRKECEAIMLSLWDKEEKVTMAIDLWTKDMKVEDMNVHFYQVFAKMADTYFKATNNNEVARMIEEFSKEFAGKLNLLKNV